MGTNLHIVKIGAYNKAHKARENKNQKQKLKGEKRKMKKNELEKIMSAESVAWEKLCERRWVLLVNSDMPRGCGYNAACEYTEAASERERAAWCALHDLCVSLDIKESHSEYAFECQTNFWRYATNK